MDTIISMQDMAAVYEVTDDLGIDRESINVELAKEDPGSWSKGMSGMTRQEVVGITLPASVPLEEWLPQLRAGLQEMMGS